MSRFFWFANVLFRLTCNSPLTNAADQLTPEADAAADTLTSKA